MARRLIDIRTLDGLPVLGQRYLVPCVLAPGYAGRKHGGRVWVPILGTEHNDTDLGVEKSHWHFDFRFITESQWRRWFWERPGNPLAMARLLFAPGATVQLRTRECIRQALEFPKTNTLDPSYPPCRGPVALLEPQFQHVQLRPGCRVCPHRGLPLAGLPVGADGGVVCAGHGLKWNLTTGRLMSRCTITGEE